MKGEIANLPIFNLSLDQHIIGVTWHKQFSKVRAFPCFSADQLFLGVEVEHWGGKGLTASEVKGAKYGISTETDAISETIIPITLEVETGLSDVGAKRRLRMEDEVIVYYAILVNSPRLVLGGEANETKPMTTDFEDIVDGYVHPWQVVTIAQCAPESKLMEFTPFLHA
jgi:hypothetical protein